MPTSQQEMEDILLNVLSLGASDLHLGVGYKPTVRIDGVLMPLNQFAILTAERSIELISVILGDRKDAFMEKKEIDFSYAFKYKARFRANVFFEKGFVSVALRHILSKIRTIEELNLSTILHRISGFKQGFVLLTGPSGHGKSTTLAKNILLP